MNTKLTYMTIIVILSGIIAIPQVYAQQHDVALTIRVLGAFTDHNYKLCADPADINSNCINFTGSELDLGYTGEFSFNGEGEGVGVIYGCVIDHGISAYSCDSVQLHSGNIMMNLDLSKPSKIPLPSATAMQTQTQIIEETETTVTEEDSGDDEGAADSSSEGAADSEGSSSNEWSDSCNDSGFRAGQNGPFSQETFDHCGDEEGGDDAYYNGFIKGCMDADNSKETCESATDAD